MAGTIRTFIGVPIPASEVLRHVGSDLGRLGRAVRVTPADNYHLTLKFLGDTRRAQIDEIVAAMRVAVEGVKAHPIELIGLGAFPTVARPSVVWAGLDPADEIKRLAANLDHVLEPIGFVPETRPFHPHLTLAYVKGPAPGLPDVIAANPRTAYGRAMVDSVALFQSIPTATGSRYTPLASVPLGA